MSHPVNTIAEQIPMEGMSPADRERWRTARTLTELGHLTALWLEGRLGSQPGYEPNFGPDPETTDLIPTLAAVNRAGFLTSSSQPGELFDDEDSAQCANVEGFTDDRILDSLSRVLRGTGLILIVTSARVEAPDTDGIAVTFCDDNVVVTWSGVKRDEQELRDSYDDCHPDAVAAIVGAWQVAIIDPVSGRNDVLWPTLDQWSRRTA